MAIPLQCPPVPAHRRSAKKKNMNQEPKTEYQVALNIMGLFPHDLTYWRERIGEISADLANHHGIHADVWVGAYAGDASLACSQFHLFALDLDLYTEEGIKIYREVESKVEQSLQKQMR